MYRNIINTILGLMTLWLLVATPTLAFDEGIEYKNALTPQSTETPGKIEVVEFFSYSCPYCYVLEPKLHVWFTHKPDYIAFRRIPTVFGDNSFMAKVFYTAELLGVLDQVHLNIFKAIHDTKTPLDNEAQVADWFVTQGVKREDFIKVFQSFGVDNKVRRAAQISNALGINGVPSFLVNGQYITSPSMTASTEITFQVIEELAAQAAQAAHIITSPPASPSTP